MNLNSGLIRIMGKGEKERYVQISNDSVLMILRKYYEENKSEIKKEWFFFHKQQRQQIYRAVHSADVEEVYWTGRNRTKHYATYVPTLICYLSN